MKRHFRIRLPKQAILPFLLAGLLISCREQAGDQGGRTTVDNSGSDRGGKPGRPLSEEFKKYWYAGDAEITSYKLKQARYGEIREGHAVLIYVTEPFLKEEQVKAEEHHPDNIPVLKLNTTKKFITGIYPYSIMTSSFYSVNDDQHAIKISASVQEWCGHVYTQLNNREKFEIISHSYFEKEGDQRLTLERSNLENEVWNRIRINPGNLPVGNFKMLPSLEYIRLAHIPIKAYEAIAKLTGNGESMTYEIHYPGLERTLTITFGKTFPYTVENWSETAKSGFGPKAVTLTSTAVRMKFLKTPYWQQNRNKDVFLRDSLGL